MPQPLRSRRSYDHRIREIVCQTGNPRIFHHLRIPRSTTASWLARGRRSVVSLDWQHDMASVLDENKRLKRRAERQTAIIRLLVVLLKVSGFRLDEHRLPDGKAKAKVLRAVERSKGALALKSALRLVRLSPARYHAWKRAEERCALDDRSSCPRSHPAQLTPTEVSTIKEMVPLPSIGTCRFELCPSMRREPARSLRRQQPGPSSSGSVVGGGRVAVCIPKSRKPGFGTRNPTSTGTST